jgi:2,4-dienoyl-CoA reductase-like NADH-dependent reductase (Old Yellow Enzyme family)
MVPNTSLALVDGFRTKFAMDNILNADVVDLISMSKPLIIEPDFPDKLANGQLKSECIDCRKCVSSERFGKQMLTCAVKNP